MYGLGDDIQAMDKEIERLKSQLKDVKVLVRLLLDNPQNDSIKKSVKIAVNNIE